MPPRLPGQSKPPPHAAAAAVAVGAEAPGCVAPPRERARASSKPDTDRASRLHDTHPQANLAASAFKARALPLHVNFTHTPPVLADDGTASVAAADPGFIGTTALVPTTFATGSYGWKGTKRVTLELQNPDDGADGEKEKVHVMISINATVIGSKNAGEGEGEGDAEGEAKAEGGEEAAAEEEAEKAVEQAVAEEKEVAEEKKELANGETEAAANGEPKEAAMEDVKQGE
ncbi:hypothetical protein ACG7TL_002403 [Trametes sanguinea]